MRTHKLFIVTLLLLAAAGSWLALGGLPAPIGAQGPTTVQQYGLTWQVIADGGTTMSSSSYTLMSTTGQPVAGPSSNADHTLLSGYWQEFLQVWEALLPVLRK